MEAFSSSGDDAIHRSIDLEIEDISTPHPVEDKAAFEEYYDIGRTIEQIKEGDYKRVRKTHSFIDLGC